jgi:1,4-dihydroxy-2-naphthoyl-CoA hydrolase
MIWNRKYSLEEIQQFCKHTMVSNLGIEFLEIGDDFLVAKMPVDARTRQPVGILHGGASLALAETIGSVAAHMTIDNKRYLSVGLEINANHIKSKKDGFVVGKGKPLHIGKKTQVWHIEILDENNKLICISRLTIAIIENRV